MLESTHKTRRPDARDELSSVVLFGYGAWGRTLGRHLRELGVLRAVIDPEAELNDLTLPAGVPGLARFEDLSPAFRASLTAAVIATPAHTHAAEAQRALRAGLDVLVEKPFTTSAAAARALIREATRRRRRLAVGHQLLSHPGFLGLRQLVANGELGSIRRAVAERRGQGRRRAGEDVLLSFAPHDLSMICALFDGPARSHLVSVQRDGRQGGPDACRFRLDFAGGARAEGHVAWNDGTRRRRIAVEGTRGHALFDELDPKTPLRIFNRRHPEGRPVPVPRHDTLEAHLRSFLSGQPVGADATEALRVTELIEELREAAIQFQDLAAESPRSRKDRMRSSSSIRAE